MDGDGGKHDELAVGNLGEEQARFGGRGVRIPRHLMNQANGNENKHNIRLINSRTHPPIICLQPPCHYLFLLKSESESN